MQQIYFTKIIKVGSSHGIVIPSNILLGMNWQRGDMVTFGFNSNNDLVIRRLTDKEIKGMKPDIKY